LTLQEMLDDDGEGLFIVENGTCKIVHRYDQFEVRELRRWDFFGESDLLKVIVRIISYIKHYRAILILEI